ncbi:MAG: NAD(P)-binding domain-containing protein [Proteobacteria bacterium]|nr:NAD(P)-binding domain-containing protein [Pseudomonadota bacterium]
MGNLNGISIGFLGLGEVGRPVLRRLKFQGASIHATSRSPALRYKIARDAVDLCSTPAEINDKIGDGILILMLSKESLIDAFLTGEDGLLSNLKSGAVLVDLGMTSQDATRKYAAQFAEKGVHWVDAPAIGSEQEALEGHLKIRAGGRQEDFERVLPVLKAISDDIERVGDVGAGQAAIATV